MSNPFAAGKKALAICDRCGLSYKFNDLRKETVNRNLTNLKVCPECLDIDHEQLQLGRLDPTDPIALREPRPDRSDGTSPNDRYLTSISYDFNNSTDLWTPTTVTSPVSTFTANNTYATFENGSLTSSSIGIRRQRSSSPLSIDTSVYKKVRSLVRIQTFGIATSQPWRGDIAWIRTTDADSFQPPSNSVIEQPDTGLYPIGRWMLLEWDLTGASSWSGTVDGFRFTPTIQSACKWDIEYLRFESV